MQRLEDSTQLLGSKINEQYQTKVETAGKYRARLSGIVLMNAFHNVGGSDNLDFPNYAQPVGPGVNQGEFWSDIAAKPEIGLGDFRADGGGSEEFRECVVFRFAGGFPPPNQPASTSVSRACKPPARGWTGSTRR